MQWKLFIRLVVKYLLILVFIYAGLTKVWEGNLFYQNLLASPIVGNETIALISSWVVPFLEILTGVLLIISKTRNKGFYLAIFLLMVYTLYLIDLLFFSSTIPCTCRAFFQFLGWFGHLYFTMSLTLLVILTIIFYPAKKLNTNPYITILLLRNKSRSTPKTCKKE